MMLLKVTSRPAILLVMFPGVSSFAFSSRSFPESRSTAPASTRMLAASSGDAVRVKWSLKTVEGGPVDLGLPFDQGEVRFVVNGGGYLPCLHRLASDGSLTDEPATFSVKASECFGEGNPDLGPVDLPVSSAPAGLKTGQVVQLQSGLKARVTKMTDETFTIDANDELAGRDWQVEAALLEVDPQGSKLEAAHFALGCFWGGELFFQRVRGVVRTSVGYSNGAKEGPTYEEVCSGSTGHTEALEVLFDPSEVSYSNLLDLFWERLGESAYLLNQVGNDKGTQYRHGIYWRSEEQKAEAQASLVAAKELGLLNNGQAVYTEVVAAEKFWPAEDYHQQYLTKGGQSAKKQDTETIRCYG
mmetsp:Transcript_58794/g.110963  ORF Transcript_58794/g.110963 Transcript_58794/m.110963 type:complete len:357 (+) Transcript_58794:74-1144(+)